MVDDFPSLVRCSYVGSCIDGGAKKILISVLFTSGLFRRTRKQLFADHRAKYVDPSNDGSIYPELWALDRSSVLKGL